MVNVYPERMEGNNFFSHVGEVKNLLIKILSEIVTENRYYLVDDVLCILLSKYKEKQPWITNCLIAKLLRELGFNDKKRASFGMEYLIYIDDVKRLLNVNMENKLNTEKDNLPGTVADNTNTTSGTIGT